VELSTPPERAIMAFPNAEEERRVLDEKREEIAEEIADIVIYVLYFCDVAGLDLEKALREKIARNEIRFPLEGK